MQINIEKNIFYGILLFIVLITSGIFIYANVDTSKAWHDANSIYVTINGVQMSLQDAITNKNISGGVETEPLEVNSLKVNQHYFDADDDSWLRIRDSDNGDMKDLAAGQLLGNTILESGNRVATREYMNNVLTGYATLEDTYQGVTINNCYWTDWDFEIDTSSFWSDDDKISQKTITCGDNEIQNGIDRRYIVCEGEVDEYGSVSWSCQLSTGFYSGSGDYEARFHQAESQRLYCCDIN